MNINKKHIDIQLGPEAKALQDALRSFAESDPRLWYAINESTKAAICSVNLLTPEDKGTTIISSDRIENKS